MRTHEIMYGRMSLLNEIPAASIAGQFGGEEDYGNEYEQRAEQVCEIRYEVGVVVEHYRLERCMILRELGKVLVDIENY